MTHHTEPRGGLRVSVRELKLTAERHLMLHGVPKGVRPAVRDLVADAEALGLGALEWLDRPPRDGWRPPRRRAPGGAAVDAGGVPSLFVAPLLLDLVIAAADRDGGAVLDVTGAPDPALLGALVPAAHRYGARLEAAVTGPDSARLRHLGAAAPTAADRAAAPHGGRHLTAAVHGGFDVDAALWWRLYHRSNDALTEDTPLSRGHAGALPAPGSGAPAASGTDPDYVAAGSG
ncbi:hypothetical protein CLV63_10792 [Murinocardiopsis flavida]|uniref:Uncharacterized protein n=1 Tax=Murinocardiopsis flavida TaxID=645275 RepID=A0A2P8DKG9_9ACTN|nr:hypothetical protein [Murinocardiopsis flavida]PSK97699.1 hypothetical protein CLV63_10792 [Murinocardiopsis flavida]